MVNEVRRFLSQFSTIFYEILHTLFSIHVVTTVKVSRSFEKCLGFSAMFMFLHSLGVGHDQYFHVFIELGAGHDH